MQPRETQPRTRYGCQEAREDSEQVLSDRAAPGVAAAIAG